MEPFSDELLTILVLISVSWAGVTCLAVVITFIVYLCLLCSKRRHRLKSVGPAPVHSRSSLDSSVIRSPSITPVPSKVPAKKIKKPITSSNLANTIHEQPYSSYSNEQKHQQREHIQDKTKETTTKFSSLQTDQPRQQQRPYPLSKPQLDLRVNERGTPYPPDVIEREKVMKRFNFPDDKN